MQRTPKAGGTTAKKTSTKTREKRFKGLKPTAVLSNAVAAAVTVEIVCLLL